MIRGRPRNAVSKHNVEVDRSATPRARKVSTNRGRPHRKFKSMDMDSEHRIDFSDLDIISVMEPSIKSMERETKMEGIRISRVKNGAGKEENEMMKQTQNGSPRKSTRKRIRSKRRAISRGRRL